MDRGVGAKHTKLEVLGHIKLLGEKIQPSGEVQYLGMMDWIKRTTL